MIKHKHLIVIAECSNPPRYEQNIIDWSSSLIRDIGMKIMMGPYAKYVTVEGNRGLTVATIIETSHVVMHTWDESDPAVVQLDVYTCGSLNTDTVFDWLEQYQPVRKQYKYLDRESDLVLEPVSDPQDRRQGRYSTQALVDATLAWIGD